MEAQRGLKHLVNSFLVSLCLTLACAAVAFANPCARDIKALCPNVTAGEGRIADCLRKCAPALSSACKQQLEELQAQIPGLPKACEDDIVLLCPGVKPGEGRIAQCLKAHGDRLSPMCKRAMLESLQ